MNTQVETEDKVTKRQVAKHSLLSNTSGSVAEVEKFEEANGIRYLDIASGQTIDYFPNETATKMLALFGARTLATNEASAARNGKDATPQEQVDAINDRFAGIELGEWVDRTREGGPRIDLPTLATAVVEMFVTEGKLPNEDARKAAAYAKVLENLGNDKAQVSKARSNPVVAANYDRLRNKKTASADELAGLIA